MSERILKLLGTEAALSTATTLSGAQLVRVYNDTGSAVLLTVKSGETTTGTVTVKSGEVVFVRKQALETIAAASAVKAVSVAFGD